MRSGERGGLGLVPSCRLSLLDDVNPLRDALLLSYRWLPPPGGVREAGVRSFSYTLGASSMKAQAGTLAKLGCMIQVDCDDGAIDSVELFINFLAEEELADGYFMARVRARVPGFD